MFFAVAMTAACLTHTQGRGPETTYSSRWPLLFGPLVQPHRWRHCTRSPPTAPAWCPGFPGIRLHSQSPRLQEKVWWEKNKTKCQRYKLRKQSIKWLRLQRIVPFLSFRSWERCPFSFPHSPPFYFFHHQLSFSSPVDQLRCLCSYLDWTQSLENYWSSISD